MTTENIRKIMFMMFEESLLDDIIKTHKNYRYLINDKSLDFMCLIAKAHTTKDEEFLKTLKEMWDFEPTVEFPNPRGSVCLICENALQEGLVNKTQLPNEYLNVPKTNLYKSPNYNYISINGNSQDTKVSLTSLLQSNIADKVIFRENIDKVDDPYFKNHLKLVHCVNSVDLEYAQGAIEYFLGLNPDGIFNLSPYLIIIDLLEAKIRLNSQFSSKEVSCEISELFKILKDTIHSLDVINLKMLYKEKMEVLNELKNQKEHLILLGIPRDEIEDKLDKLLKV